MSPATEPKEAVLLRIDRDECLQLEKSLTREWVETDGRGGYASSTALMCPTRRYHGLLVVPPPASPRPHLFVSRFEETLHRGGKTFPLSMARYPGLWSPLGHQSIEHFELVPYPSSVYRIGRARVRREILMLRGRPAVLSRYRVTGLDGEVELRLRPLLPCREAGALTFENLHLSTRVHRIEGGIRVRPYVELPAVTMTLGGAACRFEADPVWYRRLEYAADLGRGYDGHEDQYSPGSFRIRLAAGAEVVVACTIDDGVADPVARFREESARRRREHAGAGTDLRARLALAADDFLYEAPGGRRGVIAGWPWFGEWGRDTFVALPGLTLARGRVEACGEVLEGALPYLQDGLLPNIFGADRATSDYGSADAALWFARAVDLYAQAGGAADRVRGPLGDALTEIATCYRDGTRLGLRCDASGLLAAGTEEGNATWMDARTADGPVTPRDGFAVEVNALWYALLAQLEALAADTGDAAGRRQWGALRRTAGAAFLDRFWLPRERYLADCWKDGRADRAVRPNMVIAAALAASPLTRGKRTDVVARAEAELLTPRGLRSLAPKNPAYRGHYGGDARARDTAYHQGTVWPWLLGFHVEAYLRAQGRTERALGHVRGLLDGFADHLGTQGLGQVSEVFDGDPPHRPGGTIAQAWSVAELLRGFALLEGKRA